MPKTDTITINIPLLLNIRDLVLRQLPYHSDFTITETDELYIVRATDGFLIANIGKTPKTDPDA